MSDAYKSDLGYDAKDDYSSPVRVVFGELEGRMVYIGPNVLIAQCNKPENKEKIIKVKYDPSKTRLEGDSYDTLQLLRGGIKCKFIERFENQTVQDVFENGTRENPEWILCKSKLQENKLWKD